MAEPLDALVETLAMLRDHGLGLSVAECVAAVRVAAAGCEHALRRLRKRREYLLAVLAPTLDVLRDAHRLGHDVPDDVMALVYDAERRGMFYRPGTLAEAPHA